MPEGRSLVVNSSGAGVTEIFALADAMPPELSMACTATTETPGVVAVPEITPAADSEKPDGRAPLSSVQA